MRVLVIAPHPDDEAIGVGGAVALHRKADDEVHVMYMTRGEKGCPGMEEEATATLRVHEGYEAALVTGSQVVDFWHEPDGSFSGGQELISRMAALLVREKPDVVYVTHPLEQHPDHAAGALLVKAALQRSLVHPEVWMYEVWTPMPEYDKVVDITDVIGIKLRAIRRHESQVNRIRFDEAALSLARFRGELHNRPHGPYAEVLKRMTI